MRRERPKARHGDAAAVKSVPVKKNPACLCLRKAAEASIPFFIMKAALRTHFFRLTLAAFLVHALLPFFAVYDAIPLNTHEIASVFGEKILICTENGFEFVSVDELGHQPAKPHTDYKCALCYVAAKGVKHTQLPAIEIALAQPAERSLTRHFAYRPPATRAMDDSPSIPRAPPFPV